jgi:two-component system OmpR family sensor kinase
VAAVTPVERDADTLREILHEIRTPLAALSALTPMLDEQARETYLSVLGHLSGILHHALECVEYECAERECVDSSGSIQVAAVVADAVLLVEAAGSRGRFFVDVDASLRVQADRVLLAQILVNLISNAVRHSPAEAPVEVRAVRRGGVVVISVADQGPGVPGELAGRIFERGATFGEHHGSGIGLALSRRLAEHMDGSLELSSDDGALFELSLPADSAA